MKKICFIILFLVPTLTFADICKRNEAILNYLEKVTKKKCHLISVKELAEIDTIDLIGKKVTTLNKNDLQGLSKLNWLRLGSNQIEHLEDDLFLENPNIKFLGLSNNRIKKLSAKTFAPLSQLEKVNFDQNQIEIIEEGTFKYSVKLKAISLNNNKIKNLPSHFLSNNLDIDYLSIVNNPIDQNEIQTIKNRHPKIKSK